MEHQYRDRADRTEFEYQKLLKAYVFMQNEHSRLRTELGILNKTCEYEVQQRKLYEHHAEKSNEELGRYINLQKKAIAFKGELESKHGLIRNDADILPRIESRFSEGSYANRGFEKGSEGIKTRSRSQPRKSQRDKRLDAQKLDEFHRRNHKQYENENRQLRSRLDLVESQLNKYKRKQNEGRVSGERLEGEVDFLNDQLQGSRDEVRRLQDKVGALKRNELYLQDQLSQKKKKIADLERELDIIKRSNPEERRVSGRSSADRLEHQASTSANRDHSAERRSLEKKHRDQLDMVNSELQHTKEDLKILKSRDHSAERRSLENEHRVQLDSVNNELRQTKEEIEVLKSRLSKIMGDKISHENPNISALNDPNRPVKLAERYSELYDNQWTEAFEVLSEEHGDEKTVDVLMNILLDAMKACEDEAKNQKEQLYVAVAMAIEPDTNKFPQSLLKQISDIRKESANLSAENLLKKYSQSLSGPVVKEVSAYIEECFVLCWLMMVQDPPVVLGKEGHHGDAFRADIFKVYTKSGAVVDYPVWPPLYLHENGPLLAKGVAEGTGVDEEIFKLTSQEPN